jgi:hypothetical protein
LIFNQKIIISFGEFLKYIILNKLNFYINKKKRQSKKLKIIAVVNKMETFEELIEKSDFIKNIKRMYITKVIENYNIEKVNIVYNNNIKSFEINFIKNENPYYIKYKIKRRRNQSTPKLNKKAKKVNINDNINADSFIGNIVNNNIIENSIEINDNIIENSIEINDNIIESSIEINDNIIESSTQDSSNDNVINVKNDGLDNIKKNKVIYKNVNDNPSDTNKLNHNSIEKFKHIRRNMVSQIEELLELTVHSNDLLVDVFHIINNNNPKMAIKKLNKYNSNNNYKFIQELPSRLNTINDKLIELIDELIV